MAERKIPSPPPDSQPEGRLAQAASPVDGQGRPSHETNRAEEAGERELLQKVFDRIPVMIAMYQPDTKVLRLNREFERLTGWSGEEARQVDLMERCYPDPAYREEVRNYMASLQEGWRDLVMTTKDGHWIESSWSNIRLPDDTRVGIGIDISARKQAEQALRENEERFRDLFENANDVIYTLDLEGRITSVNKRAEQVFGYTRAECLGRYAAELVPPEYHPLMRAMLQRKLEGGPSPTVYELVIVCKDGRRLPLEVSSRLIVRNGRPVGVQGIARDVSEQRRAGEALRESEERLRLALDAGHCGVWDWDMRRNRVTWSDRIYEFHGLAPGTFGGRMEDFAALIHPEDAACVAEAIRSAVQERKPYSLEFRAVRPGGEVRWLAANGRVIYDDDGQPVRMLGATLDVTERRAAEEALKEADRRKDEFLAMLAHELRNPLAPIRNAFQVLQRVDPLDPTLRKARDIIGRQVTHLARLVDDLLDVSRISRGKILLRKERLDLVPLVRTVAEDHRPLLEEAGLTLAVELPDRPQEVTGDPTRLAQVVGNLMNNAAKFTEPGGRVTIRLAEDGEGGTAALSVSDTGIGMGADILARLFEPFSQADLSLDRSRGGLGLGLALVKGLVDLHGGSVHASSPGLGQGSAFTIRLALTS
jgi:PAS domain S-box-containing protein